MWERMSSAALKIKIFDAKGTHLVPVSKSTATVGSAKHCDVVLEHSSVQPEHVRAWCEGGRIWVQDLGTTAGTSMNGIRLPPLKPMLVRELDVLKLGECPATMGFEPNLVRAPVVKPQPVIEFTATDIKPIVPSDAEAGSRHGENERTARELAELKLQLQMARLEKDSGEDLRKELAAAQEEVARLTAEKQKLKESFNHFEGDKKNFKKQLENEVAELKLKALRELKEQHQEDVRKFETWKNDAVAALTAGLRALSDQKVKSWNTRPLSKDMIFEWEGDLNHLFRRVLLNEKKKEDLPPPVQSRAEVTNTNIRALPPEATSSSVRAAQTSSRMNVRKKSRRQLAGEGFWQRLAIGGFLLAVVLFAAWFASSHWKKEGARSMASEIETSVPAPRAVAAPPAVAAIPAQAAKAKPVVETGQTRTFKKSYTDNVLYTTNYLEAELNGDFRATWLKDLTRAAQKEWKLDGKAINLIAGKEMALIQDLKRIKSSVPRDQQSKALAQMRQRESQFMRELQGHLGRNVTTDKFMRLKRTFYTRNQVYLTRENR